MTVVGELVGAAFGVGDATIESAEGVPVGSLGDKDGSALGVGVGERVSAPSTVFQ